MPPFSRIISSMPPAIMAMMTNSPMPMMPLPMAENQPKRSYDCGAPRQWLMMPMIPQSSVPMVSTAITFMPATAVMSTAR